MIEVEMTSLEIAEITGKEHRNVLRDIREKLTPEISLLKNEQSIFKVKTTTYTNQRGKVYDMFILNNYAANALVANYKVSHALSVITHLHNLELQLEQKEKELSIMKEVVWEVINGQSFISQEQALKMAGIKHPRLFMKYLKGNQPFLDSVVYDRNFLSFKQCNKHGDRYWKFTKEGFQWLINSKDKINDWVKTNKQLPA